MSFLIPELVALAEEFVLPTLGNMAGNFLLDEVPKLASKAVDKIFDDNSVSNPIPFDDKAGAAASGLREQASNNTQIYSNNNHDPNVAIPYMNYSMVSSPAPVITDKMIKVNHNGGGLAGGERYIDVRGNKIADVKYDKYRDEYKRRKKKKKAKRKEKKRLASLINDEASKGNPII